MIRVISSLPGTIGFFTGVILLTWINMYFLNAELTIGNLGITFFVIQMFLDTAITLLFSLFLAATLYKMYRFRIPEKKTGVWMLGGFLGVVVSGCPACSITLASYLGFASIVSSLPFFGIELKIVSLLLLLYVLYITLRDIDVCKVKS